MPSSLSRRPARAASHGALTICLTVFIHHAGAGGLAVVPGADPTGAGPRTEPVELAAYQAVRYVTPAGSDSRGDGSKGRPWASPGQALARIADAAPARRYAVLIAEGTYPVRALRLKPNVDLYGGFAPADWERDLLRHRTALVGRGEDRLLLGADHARVDGFTLRGGRAPGHGGAVLCRRTSPTLTNNTFEDNATLAPPGYLRGVFHQVGAEGGAIACLDYAAPRIERNLFLDNRTEIGGGGAIAMRSDSVRPAEEVPPPIVRGNVFIGNRTGTADTDPDVKKRARSSNGGAISLSNYLAEITGNLFLENSAAGNGDGGGIYCEYEASPIVARNHFVGNRAEDDGGAIYSMKLSEPRIEENFFAGNTAGAVRLSKQGRARIVRNHFFANPRGAIASGDSWALIEENVVMDNGGPAFSHQIQTAAYLRPPVLRGNVLRGNAGGQIAIQGNEQPVVEGNNVEGGYPGAGNRDTDPRRDTHRLTRPFTRAAYDPHTGRGTLFVGELLLPAAGLPGRVLRVGERWGVVHSAGAREIRLWGDLRGAGSVYELLGSYLPSKG